MLKSMTGFGKSTCEVENKKITIEIKTLNSKQADISTRISGFFREKEIEVRNLLSNELVRGKIDLSLNVEIIGESDNVLLNEPVIKSYINQIRSLQEEYKISDTDILQAVIRLPNVTKVNIKELDSNEWLKVEKAIIETIEEVNKFRLQEGEALEKDIVERINNIEILLNKVDIPEKNRIENVKFRIKNNLQEFCEKEHIDMNRFEQEMIYYIEKIDITEEKVRLSNHCKYFRETIKEELAGRKLIFISQEMGREINTLGSKANDSDLQNIVVQMKDELEKIKEQLLNVL